MFRRDIDPAYIVASFRRRRRMKRRRGRGEYRGEREKEEKRRRGGGRSKRTKTNFLELWLRRGTHSIVGFDYCSKK